MGRTGSWGGVGGCGTRHTRRFKRGNRFGITLQAGQRRAQSSRSGAIVGRNLNQLLPDRDRIFKFPQPEQRKSKRLVRNGFLRLDIDCGTVCLYSFVRLPGEFIYFSKPKPSADKLRINFNGAPEGGDLALQISSFVLLLCVFVSARCLGFLAKESVPNCILVG